MIYLRKHFIGLQQDRSETQKKEFNWLENNSHCDVGHSFSLGNAMQSLMSAAIFTATLSLSLAVSAGVERDQAKRIHDRLAGVPPAEAVLDQMEAVITTPTGSDPGPIEAAYIAMQNPAFYNVTLKNIAAPWTNRDQNIFVPLNDYIATYIGLVRDSDDFRKILYDDLLYVGTVGPDPYSNSNNNHYASLEEDNIDLGAVDGSGAGVNLIAVQQSDPSVTGVESAATAGVMTSRAAAEAFFVDGTNRAMFRYTVLNHLCYDMEQLTDTARPADRIRQDISRSPGGDSRLFFNGCVGCHSGMDPMAQAFAYYDFDNDTVDENGNPRNPSFSMMYNSAGQIDPVTETRVNKKYHINSTTFPQGYVTPDDRWDNFWREGANKKLVGWDTNGQNLDAFGNGAKSLGRELANTEAFARCHVQHAFRANCLRDPKDANDVTAVDSIVSSFKSNNYDLKRVFAETASYCSSN